MRQGKGQKETRNKKQMEENQIYYKLKEQFNNRFSCDEMITVENYKMYIESFDGGSHGKGLESYLKDSESALVDHKRNDTKVYFLMDRDLNQIAGYFSIRCGILFRPWKMDLLESEDREFVLLLEDAIESQNSELLNDYKNSGLYTYEEYGRLYEIAKTNLEIRQERATSKIPLLQATKTYPAIEIQNLCRNHAYTWDGAGCEIPFGIQTFWFCIAPIIIDVAQMVGCRYAYLFAADGTPDNYEKKKLINYYENNFLFQNLENTDITMIQPEYDKHCYPMIKDVQSIQNSMYIFMERYRDLFYNIE